MSLLKNLLINLKRPVFISRDGVANSGRSQPKWRDNRFKIVVFPEPFAPVKIVNGAPAKITDMRILEIKT
jgi:hypothetical protein